VTEEKGIVRSSEDGVKVAIKQKLEHLKNGRELARQNEIRCHL